MKIIKDVEVTSIDTICTIYCDICDRKILEGPVNEDGYLYENQEDKVTYEFKVTKGASERYSRKFHLCTHCLPKQVDSFNTQFNMFLATTGLVKIHQ